MRVDVDGKVNRVFKKRGKRTRAATVSSRVVLVIYTEAAVGERKCCLESFV